MEIIGLPGMLHESPWPKYDEEKIKEDILELPVQVNGKVRGTIMVNVDDGQEVIKEKVKENKGIMKHLEGKQIVKEIFIPGKIYNIVVK